MAKTLGAVWTKGAPRLVSSVVVMIALTLVLPTPAEAAPGCSVRNMATGRTSGTLQTALNAAGRAQTLLVQGTCRGSITIRKSVRIKGVAGKSWGKPRLRADKTPALTIKRGARVNISSLTIRIERKGANNHGNTTLVDVQLRTQKRINNHGTLRLSGNSSIRDSSGFINRGRLELAGTAKIRQNNRGWFSVRNHGTVVMNGRSSIGHNHQGPREFCFAGAFWNRGRLVMNHNSSFSGQRYTGAVANYGTMEMNHRSSVHHNTNSGCNAVAGGLGGGVYNRGTLIMRNRSSIHHNVSGGHELSTDPELIDFDPGAEPRGRGGGVYNIGRLVLQGSAAIHDNKAAPFGEAWPGRGGGIYSVPKGKIAGVRCGPGTLANVYANTPDDCFFHE